jgi:hypothetical protein
MLQPHSLLWHYLWVAPCALLIMLALLMRKRGLHRDFPAFFCYAIFEAVGGGIIYALDLSPQVSGSTYWRGYFLFSVIDVCIKSAVAGELFSHLLRPYPPLGNFGRNLTSGVGIVLGFAAIIIAAYSNLAPFWLISATRVLGRSASVVQCGLIIFLLLFAQHYHLRWGRPAFGIALGFGISGCIYLVYWALTAEWLLGGRSYLLDFLLMATYHLCVLIWCYYLLVPQKKPTTSAVPLPENNLAVWNRELERLLQQ